MPFLIFLLIFLFAPDFNKSLDAHTVELVDVQYSSYVWVLCCVVLSEFLIRFCGPSEYAQEHGQGRVVDDKTTVYLFFTFGALICLSYMYLYRACRRALLKALQVKFGCDHLYVIGRSLEHKIAQQEMQQLLAESERKGGAKKQKRRDINDVQKDLRPFTDPGYFEGIEREEHLKQQPTLANSESLGELAARGAASNEAEGEVEKSDNVRFSVEEAAKKGYNGVQFSVGKKNADEVSDGVLFSADRSSDEEEASSEGLRFSVDEAQISLPTLSSMKTRKDKKVKSRGLKHARGSVEQLITRKKLESAETASMIELPVSRNGGDDEHKEMERNELSVDAEETNETHEENECEQDSDIVVLEVKRVVNEAADEGEEKSGEVHAWSNDRAQQVADLPQRRDRSISDTVALFFTNKGRGNIRARPQKYRTSTSFFGLKQKGLAGDPQPGDIQTGNQAPASGRTAAPPMGKSKVGAERMIHHAGANRRLRHNSMVKRKLDSSQWQADAIIECFEAELPFGSITLLRQLIDCVRFTSNFYLALYFTIFAPLWSLDAGDDDEEYGMAIGSSDSNRPIAFYLALFSFLPVMAFNLLYEPFVSVQYSTICTMSCINPLLLGETVAHVNETTKMYVY